MSWSMPRAKECTWGRSASRAAVVHAASWAGLSLRGHEKGSEGTHDGGQRRHLGAGRDQGFESFTLPLGEIRGLGQQ